MLELLEVETTVRPGGHGFLRF